MAEKEIKRKKNPKFLRQDSYKKKRLGKSWRKPRGWDSKLRKRMQRQVIVQPGYGSPASIKGFHISGLEIIHVKTIDDVKRMNPKVHGAIISGKLGTRKRLEIMTELVKSKITILNINKPEEYIKSKQDMIEARKKEKQVRKEEPKKEEPKKKSIEDALSEEEKKKLEKKEIDKLLTKKF
jgi:large subunit ribosomal protein L32e